MSLAPIPAGTSPPGLAGTQCRGAVQCAPRTGGASTWDDARWILPRELNTPLVLDTIPSLAASRKLTS